MAASSTRNISASKPKASGGVLHGPLGSVLPTDEVMPILPPIVPLGYVNEDGLQPGGERSLEEKRDWAGDVIANLQSGHSSNFSFTLLGAFDPDVLKAVFGAANVVVTEATAEAGRKISITETGSELDNGVWIFEMAVGGKVKRIVVPNGQVGTVEELPYVPGDLQGFTVTVNCYPDENGVKAYRYMDDGVKAA